ncbi:MAG: phospho-sugar mutase, partial [Ruminococcus sp.]|nr:phospho-sugar mutase [Ruminococcus sp.]
MEITKLYESWCKNAVEDQDLIAELESIRGNEKEIYERFYTALKFGTAGLRGVIGAGTNRMNIYVVRQATQGLANYVINKYGKGAVAISHDSRIKADLFMIEAAKVLAANGIKTYITTELQPTPVLSYLVRYFKCQAGIMVTASHNPAKYNGYKAYGEDGCQMTDNAAQAVYDEITKLDIFSDVKTMDFDEAIEKGLIEYVDDSVYDTYLDCVLEQQVNPGICEDADISVVYTPLNGAGNKLVRKVLSKIGVKEINVVKEQEMPDGNFTTCPYPNPEIKEALQKGLEL